MTYVPTPVFVPPQQPPSPETQELARRLTTVIEDFQQGHPDLDPSQIEAAVEIAGQNVRQPKTAARMVAFVLFGLLFAGLGAMYFFRAAVPPAAVPGLLVGVFVFAFLILLVVKLGR